MMTFDKASSDLLDMQRRSAQMGFDNRAMGNGGVPFTDYLDSVHDASVGRRARVMPQAMADGGGGVSSARALAGLRAAAGGGGDAGDEVDWTTPYGGDRLLASNAHELANKQIFDQMHPEATAYSKASVERQNASDMARTRNDIDAGPGQDMAVRALQRHVQGMAATDEEEGREYWTPMNQGVRQQKVNDALSLQQPLTDRAAMLADSRVKSAIAQADSRIEEARRKGDAQTVSALTAARAKLLTSQYGDTDAQSAEMDRLAGPLNGLLAASGTGGGVGTYPPEVEAKIAPYVKAGASRADTIAHLKQTGVIK
jgi:hypothetical protein